MYSKKKTGMNCTIKQETTIDASSGVMSWKEDDYESLLNQTTTSLSSPYPHAFICFVCKSNNPRHLKHVDPRPFLNDFYFIYSIRKNSLHIIRWLLLSLHDGDRFSITSKILAFTIKRKYFELYSILIHYLHRTSSLSSPLRDIDASSMTFYHSVLTGSRFDLTPLLENWDLTYQFVSKINWNLIRITTVHESNFRWIYHRFGIDPSLQRRFYLLYIQCYWMIHKTLRTPFMETFLTTLSQEGGGRVVPNLSSLLNPLRKEISIPFYQWLLPYCKDWKANVTFLMNTMWNDEDTWKEMTHLMDTMSSNMKEKVECFSSIICGSHKQSLSRRIMCYIIQSWNLSFLRQTVCIATMCECDRLDILNAIYHQKFIQESDFIKSLRFIVVTRTSYLSYVVFEWMKSISQQNHHLYFSDSTQLFYLLQHYPDATTLERHLVSLQHAFVLPVDIPRLKDPLLWMDIGILRMVYKYVPVLVRTFFVDLLIHSCQWNRNHHFQFLMDIYDTATTFTRKHVITLCFYAIFHQNDGMLSRLQSLFQPSQMIWDKIFYHACREGIIVMVVWMKSKYPERYSYTIKGVGEENKPLIEGELIWTLRINTDHKSDRDHHDECSICFHRNADVRTSCHHPFCKSCMEQWFHVKKKEFVFDCPYCRTPIEYFYGESANK